MPTPQQKPQADPWEQAAQAYKQSGQTPDASAPVSNDDWRVWQAEDDPDSGPIQRMQKSFDENTKTSPSEPLLETGLKSVVGAIGRPFIHPIDTVKGMAQEKPSLAEAALGPAGAVIPMARHVWNSAKQDYHAAGGGRHGLAYAGTKMAGDAFGDAALGSALEAAPGAAEGLADAIPTRAKAGRLFGEVMDAAGDQPVTLSPETMAPLERTQQLAIAGGKPFGTADKLYQRIQTINPLTYREARDFAQNMSLSPEEKMGLKRSMRYEVPRMAKSFNDDVARAAEAAGKGAEHQKAMSMYRRASRNAAIAKGVAKYGGRAALGAAGAGGLYELGKTINK